MEVNVQSEIGRLEGVILHTPGPEIENMNPENVERALYSDILNRQVALKEYAQFAGVLNKVTTTFQVKDLLQEVLLQRQAKQELVEKVCTMEAVPEVRDELLDMPADALTKALIEGLPLRRNTLSNFLNQERYALRPLHNFFFTRDASVSVLDRVLVNKMANRVRDRESWIMESIFRYSKQLHAPTFSPSAQLAQYGKITIEGGDVQIARHDTLVVGLGIRTSAQGIDYIISQLGPEEHIKHIVVQELPDTPESFIHLDMVFTFLDVNKCMIFEPLILKNNRFRTIHIELHEGKVHSITEASNLLNALSAIGIELEPVLCGGSNDPWIQEREQWHSGANFFAFAPGQIIGYARNVHTIEALSQSGFEVLKADDIIAGTVQLPDESRCVVTIEGAELARGGGGARCMTMPVRRNSVNW